MVPRGLRAPLPLAFRCGAFRGRKGQWAGGRPGLGARSCAPRALPFAEPLTTPPPTALTPAESRLQPCCRTPPAPSPRDAPAPGGLQPPAPRSHRAGGTAGPGGSCPPRGGAGRCAAVRRSSAPWRREGGSPHPHPHPHPRRRRLRPPPRDSALPPAGGGGCRAVSCGPVRGL